GAAGSVRALAGPGVVAITCGGQASLTNLATRDFHPLAQFPIPGYESQILSLPSVLEGLEHCGRERNREIVIGAAGPMGLIGLAAGKLLGARVTGICNTDLPSLVRRLSGSAALEELAWAYMRWFFGSMQRVLVASRRHLELLAEHGFD